MSKRNFRRVLFCVYGQTHLNTGGFNNMSWSVKQKPIKGRRLIRYEDGQGLLK